MSRPYSEDLRSRAVSAVDAGLSRHKAASLFSVGVSSVIRWCQLKRTTGGVKAKPMGGRRRWKLEPHRGWILARIEQEPSLAIEELRAELAERGMVVAHGTLWAFLDREKLTFKKNSARRRARAA
jgi:putative transposase